jgi:hypothetical protein
MNTYYVEQRAEIWVRTTVQANNAKAALELGKQQLEDGDYYENMDTLELQDEYWIGGTRDGIAVSLNKDGSVTELRYKD